MGRWLTVGLAGTLALSSCGLPASPPAAATSRHASNLGPAVRPTGQATFRAHSLILPSAPNFYGPPIPDFSFASPRLGSPSAAAGLPFGGLSGCGLPTGGFGSFGGCGSGYPGLGYGATGYGGLGYNLGTVGIGCGLGTTVRQLPAIQQPAPAAKKDTPPSASQNQQPTPSSPGAKEP